MTISTLIKGAVASAIVAGTLVATAAPASASVVCNRWGECWRVRDRYDYPPRVGIVIRSDSWWRLQHARYHWRGEHRGRGYWRHGVWVRW